MLEGIARGVANPAVHGALGADPLLRCPLDGHARELAGVTPRRCRRAGYGAEDALTRP